MSGALLWLILTGQSACNATRWKFGSQIQEFVLCWGVGAVEACVEESEGSPMVGVGVLRGQKEKVEGS